jgi:glycosyltransferase
VLVSIITVTLNAASTIEDTITRVLAQTYKNVEYIIVDGGSKDGTMDIVNKYKAKIAKVISEPDKGLYDGMNKGIKLATGDLIGILNADDIYAHDLVIENTVKKIKETGADLCYSDLVYVNRDNTDKVVRYWKSGTYDLRSFEKGWIPPHPTVFIKREIYEKYGVFDLSLKVVADHEILCRFMCKHKVKSCYIPEVSTKMRLGGASSKNLTNYLKQNLAIIKAMRKNQIPVSPLFFILKPIEKFKQFFLHPDPQ